RADSYHGRSPYSPPRRSADLAEVLQVAAVDEPAQLRVVGAGHRPAGGQHDPAVAQQGGGGPRRELAAHLVVGVGERGQQRPRPLERKSTRLNSSRVTVSYAD